VAGADSGVEGNPLARAGEARVMSCAEFWGTGKNPAQGVPDHRSYAFGHWQYVDVLVFWAGSVWRRSACFGDVPSVRRPLIVEKRGGGSRGLVDVL
jgi:hypothetical protein